MSYNITNMNDMCIDVLKEIANIGSGNAANSLADMLDNIVEISVPAVSFIDANKVAEILGGMENIVVSVLAQIMGDIGGIILCILNPESAKDILSLMSISEDGLPRSITDMGLSALTEIGNIIMSSYVNSISGLCGMEITINVPSVCIDMVGAVISEPIIQTTGVADEILFIKNDFFGAQRKITANMLLLPDITSLPKLMNSLGISL